MTAAPTGTDAGRLPREAAGRLIAELYAQHGRALYGVCRMLLRDPHEAEDATQSAFLSAYGALVRGGLPRDRTAWIFAIARNECRTRIRARMSTPMTTGVEALDGLPGPMTDPTERLPDATVQKALQALSPRQREAVVLHDVYGLRTREVGRALGVSLPAVEALLFRARRQLRVRLQPVAGVLTLPVGLRDALAAAIPGFGDGSGAAGAAATGAAGLGLLAKLASAPSAAKVAAAAVAVGAAGSVAVVDSQPGRPREQSALVAVDGVGVGTTVRAAAPGKASVTSPAASTPGRTIGRRSRVGAGDEDATRSGGGDGEDVSQRDDGAAPTDASPDHEDGDTSGGATPSRAANDDDTDTSDDGARGPGGGGTSSSGPGDDDDDAGGDEKATGPESPDPDVDDPVEQEDESEPDDSDDSGSGSGHDGGSAIEKEDEESSGSGSSRSGSSGSSSSGDDSPDEDEPDDEDGTD